MTKLSDTQAIILSAAAQRPGHIVLPLPSTLRGGAAAKVVGAMLRKGLIDEVEADPRMGETLWRETGDRHGTTLIATEAGLSAIGIEPKGCADDIDSARTGADVAPAPKPRDGTKQALVIAMLRRKEGATIAQIAEVLRWRPHTVRGFFAGTLKKRLGLEVTSEKVGEARIYRLPPA